MLIDDTTHIDGTWNAGYVGLFTGGATTHAAQEFDDVTMKIDNDADGTLDEELFSDDFSSNSVTLNYDDNGNLTFDGVHTFVYDGWNRLRRARMVATDTTDVATYEYYGDNRRSEKIVQNQGAEAVDNDGGDTTVRFYYGSNRAGLSQAGWNIVETRNGSNQTTYQYVWGTKYTDELIMIDKNLGVTVDNDADADTLSAAEENPVPTSTGEDARYLVHQDRNWNVIALTDYDANGTNAGVVVERYSYTPYGRFVVLKGDSSGNQLGNVLLTSAVGNVFAHQGLPNDFEKESYQNRYREYFFGHQRFGQRDPYGYLDGSNTYLYQRGIPSLTDSDGRSPQLVVAVILIGGMVIYVIYEIVHDTDIINEVETFTQDNACMTIKTSMLAQLGGFPGEPGAGIPCSGTLDIPVLGGNCSFICAGPRFFVRCGRGLIQCRSRYRGGTTFCSDCPQ